jgi:hypothetical protein
MSSTSSAENVGILSATKSVETLCNAALLHEEFGEIPDPRIHVPQDARDWEILNFNLRMEIPNRFNSIEEVSVWIRDCPYLNRQTVALFLTEAGHEAVTASLSKMLLDLHDGSSLVDSIKIYYAVVGIMSLDGVESAMVRTKSLLEHFAKAYCETSSAVISDWLLVADIAGVLLQLSRQQNNGTPPLSQQNFFIDVRAINSNRNILPSKVVADIYNDFTATGSFKPILAKSGPSYYISDSLKADWLSVTIGYDGEKKDCWVVVTVSTIFLFITDAKQPFACIPTKFIRASASHLGHWVLDIHSFSGHFVPLIKLVDSTFGDTEGDWWSPSRLLRVPVISLATLDQSSRTQKAWLDLIEDCSWKNRHHGD